MQKAYIKTYYGYGDNLWQYPFIVEAASKYELYLETYFPFLFDHLPIKFVQPKNKIKLDTCKKALDQYDNSFFVERPSDAEHLHFPYYLAEFRKKKDLVECFSETINPDDDILNETFPIKSEWEFEALKIYNEVLKPRTKLCIIRPPADRTDWKCPARVPDPKYFQYIIDKYKDKYTFITVGNKEIDRYVQDLQGIDRRFDNGEIPLTTLIALCKMSDLIVTYNCFFFPLGVKVKTNTLVIGGGYTDPRQYVDFKRMDLNHVRIVTPDPVCTCINLTHNCTKEIDFDVFEEVVENLIEGGEEVIRQKSIRKKNLLISRIRAYRCMNLYNNKHIRKYFNIFTIDHTSVSNYLKNRSMFRASYQFPSVGDICHPIMNEKVEEQVRLLCEKILTENKIDLVINAQPLHPLHTIMEAECKKRSIDTINYETFFDDKMVLDRTGSQYTESNDIREYVKKISIPSDFQIEYPKASRQVQPRTINRSAFFKRYSLREGDKHVVVLGQLNWDMSLKHSSNPDINGQEQFLRKLFESNPDTIFLFKNHPQYKSSRFIHEMNFVPSYKNVRIINESLETLFDNFECFVSFSSSCIMEGLIRGRKFATIGYHFCNDPELVFQLKTNEKFFDIYESLQRFVINQKLLSRYLYFVCNLYAVPMDSEQLFHRLSKTSKDYFLKGNDI